LTRDNRTIHVGQAHLNRQTCKGSTRYATPWTLLVTKSLIKRSKLQGARDAACLCQVNLYKLVISRSFAVAGWPTSLEVITGVAASCRRLRTYQETTKHLFEWDWRILSF